MKLLHEAARGRICRVSPRAWLGAVLALLMTMFPTLALAGEADVRLDFSKGNQIYLIISLGFGLIALVIAGLLAKNAPWQQLDANGIAKVVQKVFDLQSKKLIKRKLGQAAPVVGIVVGATLNARTIHQAAEAAELVYRQRFLQDKYGLPPLDLAGGVSPVVQDEHQISISDIVDATVVEERDDDPRQLPS